MNSDVKNAVEHAIRALTAISEDDGELLLSVPVSYPSGALATLAVSGGRSSVTISDRGAGFFEAQMYAADAAYARVAKRTSERFGVKFDGHAILALELPFSALAGGIVAVANASCLAAAEAVRIESERKAETHNDAIYDRVRMAFPDAHVSRKLNVAGLHAEWDAHNVVQLKDRLAIFEPVSAHAGSIAAKFTMFSDLSKRDGLLLAALVENPADLTGKGQMIYDVARVLPLNADAAMLKGLAA